MRVHFYLGPQCRTEIFDPSRDFKRNKNDILEKFGIGKKLNEQEKQAECNKYVLKLMNGGIVKDNSVIFHDDRVVILPKEEDFKDKDSSPTEAVELAKKDAEAEKEHQSQEPIAYRNLSELKLENLKSLFRKHELKSELGDMISQSG